MDVRLRDIGWWMLDSGILDDGRKTLGYWMMDVRLRDIER